MPKKERIPLLEKIVGIAMATIMLAYGLSLMGAGAYSIYTHEPMWTALLLIALGILSVFISGLYFKLVFVKRMT